MQNIKAELTTMVQAKNVQVQEVDIQKLQKDQYK